MSTSIGFALREDYREGYLGGIVAAGDRDLNMAELLEQGGGTIVVDGAADPRIVTALDERPELKRVPVGDDGAAITGDSAYAGLTKDELVGRAGDLDGARAAKKDDLVVALVERDRRLAEGTLGELEAVNVDTLVEASSAREEA